MPEPLFTFQTALVKEDVLSAIAQVEEKNWKKRKETAEKAQEEFTEEKPTLEKIQTRFEGKSAEETLVAYATDGRLQAIPRSDQVLSEKEAKNLGAALLQVEKNNEAPDKLHPEVTVKGNDNNNYKLEPKELSAWLQANARAEKNIPVNEWAKDNKIGLTGHGDIVANGNETLYIETRDGERRVVGNGGLSEPIKGNYGAIRGLEVGDGDDLDVYISNDVMKDIKAGKTYEGKIFVMQQMKNKDSSGKGGEADELKLGFAASADEFKTIMTSTWKDGKDFEKLNEGKYAELTPDQYQQLKFEIMANPTLKLEKFVEGKNIDTKEFTKIAALDKTVEKTASLMGGARDKTGEPTLSMHMHDAPEQPLSSLPLSVLQQAVAAVSKGATQFHQVAAADQSSKVAVVPNEVGSGYSPA